MPDLLFIPACKPVGDTPREPCIYLQRIIVMSGMAGATGYEGGWWISHSVHRLLPIFHFLVFPCRLFFSVCCPFLLAAYASHAYGTQRFPDWPESARVAQYSAIPVNRTLYRACHDRMRLRYRRRITGFLLCPHVRIWAPSFPDAGLLRRLCWEAPIFMAAPGRLWGPRWRRRWWILQQGLSRWPECRPNFQRIVRCARRCRCRSVSVSSSPNPEW